MPSARVRAAAVADLVRWPNALIAAGGVFAGAWFARGTLGSSTTAWLALAAVALTAVANASNDLEDLEIDRVAHPTRPLPSGRLSPRAARRVTITGIVVALLATMVARPSLWTTTALVIVLMLVYGRLLKPLGLPGNLVVAVLASLPFVYGAISVGRPAASLPLIGLALPLHFAREVAKDIDDADADAPRRRTLPVALGTRAARGALLAAMAIFAVELALFAATRPLFLLAAVPLVVSALLATRAAVQGRQGAPRLFKLAMVCALLSLAVAR